MLPRFFYCMSVVLMSSLIQYMQHVEEVHNMAIQYKQQGEETKMQIPSEPTIFLYAPFY